MSLVDFNAVDETVPEWISSTVIKDNLAHNADRQMFNPVFFGFIQALLRHITATVLDLEDDAPEDALTVFRPIQAAVLEIGEKVVFDMLTHSERDTFSKSICSSMRSIFSFSDPVADFGKDPSTPSLLLEYLKKNYLSDQCAYFFRVMYESNANKNAKDHIARTTARAVCKAIKILSRCADEPARMESPLVQELSEVTDQVVSLLFNALKTRESQKNWNRMEDYHEMLADIGTEDAPQAEYLLSKFDIVTDLCDLVMQSASPKARDEPAPRVEMGGSATKPFFESLVHLASYLVRCCVTKSTDESCNTFIKGHLSKEQKEAGIEPQNLLAKPMTLPDEAISFFTHEAFFEIVLKNDFCVEDYSKALAHLSYANMELSEHITKLVVSNMQLGVDPNAVIIMRELLNLHDIDATT